MQSYTLYPPNSQLLTDEIIGSVVQRRRQLMDSRQSIIDEVERSMTLVRVDRHHDAQKNSITCKRKTSTPTELISCKKVKIFQPKRSSSREMKQQDPLDDNDSGSDQDVLNYLRKVDSEAYHRERRRRNQGRYRQKQRTMTNNLENDNQRLRDEIEELEQCRNTLSYGVTTKETIWSVAAEYFRVFRRGLQMPNGELDFLRATMAPDIDAGTVIGLEALARNWRVFTKFFQGVEVHLGRLDQIAEQSIVATSTVHATISRLTLHKMFPHLISDKKDCE